MALTPGPAPSTVVSQMTPGYSTKRAANFSTTAFEISELGPGSISPVLPLGTARLFAM